MSRVNNFAVAQKGGAGGERVWDRKRLGGREREATSGEREIECSSRGAKFGKRGDISQT